MWATLLTHAIAAFVGVTIWEMGKKVVKDLLSSRDENGEYERYYEGEDFINH